MIQFLTALAEPTRLAALQILWDHGEHCACELMERLGATQSRISRHMQVLKQAGLITDRRDAQWVRYQINPDLPTELHNALCAILAAAQPERSAA